MTRRSLFAALAGAALDPERLLWTPGRKLISIPKTSLWHHRKNFEAYLRQLPTHELIERFAVLHRQLRPIMLRLALSKGDALAATFGNSEPILNIRPSPGISPAKKPENRLNPDSTLFSKTAPRIA